MADVLNFTEEQGLAMFDALSRTNSARQIKPLDQYNYISYDHRYLYDDNNLEIGDVFLMVPPEFIHVSSESFSQNIQTLRQENSQKQKTGYHKRTVTIDLVFDGMDEINGYKVPGPTHKDGNYVDEQGNKQDSISNFYYVDGLRTLLAQFKLTPFLPIANRLLNNSYKIYVVALQSIVISTIPGFQNALSAHITLQEIDMMPYIEMPNVMYRHTIDWDLFRFYTQSILTEKHVYKNLQSLPVNRDHTAFKLSILNEEVLATIDDKTDGTTKEETVLEKVVDPASYACLVDSNDSDVHITEFQCSYANMLTTIQMSDACSPTLQYLGGLDTQFNIVFETTDTNVVGSIEQCQILNDLMARNNPKIRGSIGFVKIEADFITFCGSLFCTIEAVETHTVPGIPGLYQVRMLCVSYDIAQSRREELEGFLPFDGYESSVKDLNLEGAALESKMAKNIEQCIDQSYEGLQKKIYQDNYAEWKLRTTMEVYPDLRLPTYDEVNQAIKNINAFRKYNNKDQLPYEIYPIQPSHVIFGHGDKRDSYPNHWCDNGGPNVYSNGDSPTGTVYAGFVDPDFYVFYPNTYTSIYHQEQEEANEEDQSTGSTNASTYSAPRETQPINGSYTQTYSPSYGDGEDTDSKVTKFISILKTMLGHSYAASAEGEVRDSKGEMFDNLGLITWALKTYGILPENFIRLSSSDFDSMDIFDEVSTSDIRKGDIITDSSKQWTVICTGYDTNKNISIIEVNEMDGVTEAVLPFHVGHVYRILPLQNGNNSYGTQQSNPYISDGNQYPDENGNIIPKSPTALETTEGYQSDNPYGDDNYDAFDATLNSPMTTLGTATNTVNQDLGIWSPISESELNAYINSVAPSNSPFRNQASVFIKAGQESGLDPRYILAHAALESGWGTSKIAKDKNNYFGIGAFDSSPYQSAYTFNSGLAAGIIGGAKWIANNYYNSSYQQQTLYQMRFNDGQHQYATDPEWANKIAKIMDGMPANTSAQYQGFEGGSQQESFASFTNTDQIKLNEYDRRNRAENAEDLSSVTAPVQLDQASISELTIPPIEDDGSAWTDGSVNISKYMTMTTDEFNALAITIATECEGETLACKMAMAQYLYDISQFYYNGQGLTAICKQNGFVSDKTTMEQKEVDEAKACVQRVFQAGARWKKDAVVLAYTSMSNADYASQNRADTYDQLGSVNQHTFYGHKGLSDVKSNHCVGYNIEGYGVSQASSNTVTIVRQYSVTPVQLSSVKAFGKPIYIKPSYFDSHDNSVGKKWQELNSDLNRFNTSFVDDCQYSSKGRMVKAFPTFLFCILDDQAQWYDGRKLWTNYYVYKPVIDIQYHAANDMPTETAQITVTNTYHNLDRSSAALINYSIAKDGDYCGLNQWLYEKCGMLLGGIKITNRLVQMHSIIFSHTKVREGARVHLRMGYGSDPMSLAPIINGHISALTLGDQIGITVTSDGHELIQTITSDKTKDLNNGALGTGIGATQEAGNIIANIMVKRDSWVNHLFFAKKWFEGSKYNIEHFGLYLNDGDSQVYSGLAGGIDAGIKEQYDLLMNVYNASCEDGWFVCYRHWLYMYDHGTWFGRDGESNIVFNQYNMTPWDIFQLCAQTMPEFLIKAEKYQFDSRVYYGLPFDLTRYRYDIVDGTIYQECKANTQMHYLDSLTAIIEDQVSVTSRYSFTNAKVMYIRGKTPKATSIIHSDDTIDHSKQSTHIIDSCVAQDYLFWDGLWEFIGINQGKQSARKLGISNLLYGWQQQYQGQLLCLGQPQVKPDDYLMVNDFYAALNGLTMVREVIHSFSTSTGFTTSIVPGIIGFCPEQDSGNIELIASFLKVYAQFTEYAQSRKLLKENCERYADAVAIIESNARRMQWQIFGMSALHGLQDVVTIGKDIQAAYLVYNVVRCVKNAGNIIKAAKAIKNTYQAINTARKAVKIGKSVVSTVRLISSVNAVAEGVTSVEGTIMAVGAASAPETCGIGLAVALVVTIIVDIVMDALIAWLENRNTVVLLPLWWEGKPFVSGVKDGEKILLIKDENNGSEENTEQDGYDSDVDEYTVEDN